MKKRVLAIVLTAGMLLTASVPYPVPAAEEEPAEETVTQQIREMTEVDDISLADADTLFSQYVDKQFAISSGKAIRHLPRRNRFSGHNGIVYDKLKSAITEIASGTRSSTIINIPLSEILDNGQITYTADELGISEDAGKEEVEKALFNILNVDNAAILDALLSDLPYDLYWFDKTEGTALGGEGSYSYYDGAYHFDYEIVFQFPVSSDYSADGSTGTYETDTSKTSAASTAAQNAGDIVSAESGGTDKEVLTDFKNTICDLVSYNSDAAYDAEANYGDPWQLIYVFDNNPDTNVVCEGYAKAFKYLCDLYKANHGFADTDLDVYTVTGVMQGGTGAGRHMWNIIHTSTGNYLADLTNSDADTAGSDGSLFMVTPDEYTTDSSGRTTEYSSGRVDYTYDSEMLDQYDENEIGFNQADDNKDVVKVTDVIVAPSNTEMTVGDTAGLNVTVTPDNAADKSVTWASSDENVASVDENGTVTAISAGAATITATANDGSGESGSCAVTVNSAQKTFTDVTDTTHPYYDAIYWAAGKGITTGFSDGTFKPYDNCTRGQVVTFLWRLAGEPEPSASARAGFSDMVASRHPYYKAILWAVEKGITTGFNDGTFRPYDNCSRGQIVTFIYRYAGNPSISGKTANFKDMVSSGHPFYNPIVWASTNGITTGFSDNTFGPAQKSTRGQVVTFLYRYSK